MLLLVLFANSKEHWSTLGINNFLFYFIVFLKKVGPRSRPVDRVDRDRTEDRVRQFFGSRTEPNVLGPSRFGPIQPDLCFGPGLDRIMYI